MSNDAQLGIVRILRPYVGFEAIYEGQSSVKPIMFTEPTGDSTGGQMLDPSAGQSGYNPWLVRGVPVSPGQRVVIWLPAIVATELEVGTEPYNFLIWWRYRNAFDYRNSPERIPYHFPSQTPGVADTTPLIAGPRVVIPAAQQSVLFAEQEVATVGGRSIFNLRANDVSPRPGNDPFIFQPLIVDSSGATKNGVIQQGLLDPTVVGTPLADLPLYNSYDLIALGDELLIGAYRLGTTNVNFANWNFVGGIHTDILFSDLFGNGLGTAFTNIGIYIQTGKAP